jgi:ABC-type polysaccharide/polyol phosphate export permease
MWHNLAQLSRYRGLIQSLVARELKARYRGSVLGFFWSFVNPLLLLSIYSFVFAYIMPNDDTRTTPYPLFMFCGILPWTWFSSSLIEATNSLISGGNLIKKVLFPAEVLPIVTVLSNMVHFFLGLSILLLFFVVFRYTPDWPDLVWFPLVVLVQLIFTTGLALLLSALTVHFRDMRDLLTNLLTFWFFATPIIYPHFKVAEMAERLGPHGGAVQLLFRLNPFYHLAVSYQEILFFKGSFVDGHLRSLLLLGAASVVFFLAGYWVFDRLRDSFAEVV